MVIANPFLDDVEKVIAKHAGQFRVVEKEKKIRRKDGSDLTDIDLMLRRVDLLGYGSSNLLISIQASAQDPNNVKWSYSSEVYGFTLPCLSKSKSIGFQPYRKELPQIDKIVAQSERYTLQPKEELLKPNNDFKKAIQSGLYYLQKIDEEPLYGFRVRTAVVVPVVITKQSLPSEADVGIVACRIDWNVFKDVVERGKRFGQMPADATCPVFLVDLAKLGPFLEELRLV